MNVLIACEESQRVCIEFRKRGHNAFSCDIMECSGGHPEWHIQGDVLPLLNPAQIPLWNGNTTIEGVEFKTCDGKEHFVNGKWDMIIAFPPCTHLAVSGARHFEKKREDGRQREGLEFFLKFFDADCEHVCVENPVNIVSGEYALRWFPELAERYGLPKKPTQSIHPWMFGHPESKNTCLWLKGLPKLKATNILLLPESGHWDNQTKEHQNKLIVDGKWIGYNDPRTQVYRSKTYPAIAKAMAEQRG